jgi:hypothetical protein
MEGTIIIWKLVDIGVKFHHSSMLPTVVKGIFRIANKQAAVSSRPQQQVLELLNVARAEHSTLAPGLHESDKAIAALILILLLPSGWGPASV